MDAGLVDRVLAVVELIPPGRTASYGTVGMVAGCYVTNGKMQRGAQMRLLRDNIVIYDGAIASLQRFKDSVKEVAAGYECGITFEKFQDIKEGDIIEAFLMEQIQV